MTVRELIDMLGRYPSEADVEVIGGFNRDDIDRMSDEGLRAALEETNAVKKDEVLAKVAAGELQVDQASKLLEESEREGRGKLSCRVSEKGGVSVYGLQRMPVTLYVEQWEKLLGFGDEIRQFLKEHDSELKRKPK